MDVAQNVQDHSEDQLGNGFIGVAGGIADCDAFFSGGVETHMVYARESHIDKFEPGAAADHFCWHGHVGDDHGVRVFRLLDQRRDARGAGKISKCVSLLLKGFLAHGQFLVGNAQRFHNDDLAHIFNSFLSKTRWAGFYTLTNNLACFC